MRPSRPRDLFASTTWSVSDVVIAVAASGTTPFTLACLREAKKRGALTIGIANNRGTPLLEEADHPIWLDTGSEPIAGSTRMKAGTAQRIALNLLSSLVMILLGRVYEGLMVDVQAVNKKLVRRSETMLQRLTGRSREEVPGRARQGRRERQARRAVAAGLRSGAGDDAARSRRWTPAHRACRDRTRECACRRLGECAGSRVSVHARQPDRRLS